MSQDEIEPPTLYEVSQASRDFGLAGERQTHLSLFLIVLNGGLVILYSPSRGGKDMVVDAVQYCRPGNEIAKIPNSTSKTVLYQKHDELNDSSIHRYPDITQLDSHIETLLKEHGDGRDSVHSYTDVSGDRKEVSQVLHPPNSMILFAASDNQNFEINDYPEIRNRAIILSTDTSAGLTEKVKVKQGRMEVGKYQRKVSEERTQEIRDYVDMIPVSLYTNENSPGEVWNLNHFAFSQENPLPDMFPESRMDFKRFNKFVKATTMFHYDKRMEISTPENHDATMTLLSTPKDLWYAWKVFGEKMVLSALNLKDMDFEILELLRESGQAMSVAEVMNEMRRRGFNLSDTQARGSLEGMLEKGYILKDTSSTLVKYQPSPFGGDNQVSRNIQIDFASIIEQVKQDAREVLTEDDAEDFIGRYCNGSSLLATDPFTGEEVDILDQDLLENVKDRQEQEQEVVDDTDPFSDFSSDSSDDSSDEEEETEESNDMDGGDTVQPDTSFEPEESEEESIFNQTM